MAKQRTLAEALKNYHPPRQGYEPWHVLLRQKNPSRMAEIDALIKAWEGGGHRDKLDTRNKLAIFIARNSEGAVKNAPPVVKYIESGLWRA